MRQPQPDLGSKHRPEKCEVSYQKGRIENNGSCYLPCGGGSAFLEGIYVSSRLQSYDVYEFGEVEEQQAEKSLQ